MSVIVIVQLSKTQGKCFRYNLCSRILLVEHFMAPIQMTGMTHFQSRNIACFRWWHCLYSIFASPLGYSSMYNIFLACLSKCSAPSISVQYPHTQVSPVIYLMYAMHRSAYCGYRVWPQGSIAGNEQHIFLFDPWQNVKVSCLSSYVSMAV